MLNETTPAATAVIQKLPAASIFKPSGMWPSGIVWITCFAPSGLRRTTFKV